MEEKWLIEPSILTGIADAIREKEDTSVTIPVNSLASRIAAISTGIEVQTASGTFKTSSSGTATATCGFKPDLFAIDFGTANSCKAIAAFAISAFTQADDYEVSIWDDNEDINLITFSPSSTGGTITARKYDMDSNKTLLTNKTYSYVAVKYT